MHRNFRLKQTELVSRAYIQGNRFQKMSSEKIKLVFISDTHNQHSKLTLPQGDILIHCGDLTQRGMLREIRAFGEWFGMQKGFEHKVVVAGNHDWEFQLRRQLAEEELLGIRHTKRSIIYLQDSEITLNVRGRDIRIYGSPWQPYFQGWAFNLRQEQLRDVWRMIPDGLDVLVTHGPPFTVLDRVRSRENVGCESLLEEVIRAKPRVHAFGHIHESWGVRRENDTIFVNASNCDHNYFISNPPISIEI